MQRANSNAVFPATTDGRVRTLEDFAVVEAEAAFERLSLGRRGSRSLNQLVRLPYDDLVSACRAGLKAALAEISSLANARADAVGLLALHPVLFHQSQQSFVCPYLPGDFATASGAQGIVADTIVSVHDDIFDVHARLMHKGEIFDPGITKRREQNDGKKHRNPIADVQEQMLLLNWRSTELTFAKYFSRSLNARHILFHAKGNAQVVAKIALERQTAVYLSHPIAQPRRDMTFTSDVTKSAHSDYDRGKSLQDEICAISHCLRQVVPLVEPTAIDELRFDMDWLKDKTDKALIEGILPPLTTRWPVGDGNHLSLKSSPGDQTPFVRAPKNAFAEHEFDGSTLDTLVPALDLLKEEIMRQVTARDYSLAEQCDLIVAYRPFTKPNSPQPSGGVEKEIGVVLRKAAEGAHLCKPALIVYHPPEDERRRRKLEFEFAWAVKSRNLMGLEEAKLSKLRDEFLGKFLELAYPPSTDDVAALRLALSTRLKSSGANVKAQLDSSAMASVEQGQVVDAADQFIAELVDLGVIIRSKLHQMVEHATTGGTYVQFVQSFSEHEAERLVKNSHATYQHFLGAITHDSTTDAARRTSSKRVTRPGGKGPKDRGRTMGSAVGTRRSP